MRPLIIIPARGGSKGIPNKNIKLLHGKPLIYYSLDIARQLVSLDDVCVSTDSLEIATVAESYGFQIPFIRPAALASDTAGSRGVLIHALDHYLAHGRKYDTIILLQPTSPFRKLADVRAMIDMFNTSLDMVVSVKESHANPYFSLFEENAAGFLEVSKKGKFTRRQDCPKVFAYNGSVYVINADAVREKELNEFTRIKKFVMDDIGSVDIDTPFDWWMSEMIIDKSLWQGY